jgi:hypothetical protein
MYCDRLYFTSSLVVSSMYMHTPSFILHSSTALSVIIILIYYPHIFRVSRLHELKQKLWVFMEVMVTLKATSIQSIGSNIVVYILIVGSHPTAQNDV